MVEESVWYSARNADGSHQINLDGSYLKTFDSIADVRGALDRLVKDYHAEGTTYMIVKVTYRKTLDDKGYLQELTTTVTTVETYCKEE